MAEEGLGKFQVIYSEMPEADQNIAFEIAANALKLQDKGEHIVYQKDLAQSIKQELDKSKGGTWNVIVGKSFGSFVTHETKTISYFTIGSNAFLIWRHG
jgi:dynein light chain LC8-type